MEFSEERREVLSPEKAKKLLKDSRKAQNEKIERMRKEREEAAQRALEKNQEKAAFLVDKYVLPLLEETIQEDPRSYCVVRLSNKEVIIFHREILADLESRKFHVQVTRVLQEVHFCFQLEKPSFWKQNLGPLIWLGVILFWIGFLFWVSLV